MSAARIAVVVPVYNAGEYLPLCLASLAAQSFADFAAILVDDGSTDGSAAVCDRWAARDARFRVLHLPNGGPAAARAAGVRAAQCEYLAFCDADDLLHPAFLQTLLHAAETSLLPIACCRFDTFSDAPALNADPPKTYRELLDPQHLDALLHDHAVDYSLCNKLYDAALLTPDLLDNGLTHNEDLLANWRAFLQAPGIAFCDFAGYHYRQHGGSSSHRALTAAEIGDHLTAARAVRDSAPPSLQGSAGAFYYEKLAYLASRILRRPHDAALDAPLESLRAELRAGLRDPLLGANPRLPKAVRLAALASVCAPGAARLLFGLMLRDRQ